MDGMAYTHSGIHSLELLFTPRYHGMRQPLGGKEPKLAGVHYVSEARLAYA